ncbi:MAG: rod shape-determining protein MreD, partial [Primorskyibacter sp.]
MAKPRMGLWVARAQFLGLAGLVIFFHMLPLSLQPAQWAPPDVLLAFAFAWAQRRPDAVPPLMVAGVFLLTDLMFQRPPGLWAALVLVVIEWSKSRERRPVEAGFLLEWAGFAGAVVSITVVYRVVLRLVLVDTGPLHLATTQAALTVAIYPLVVLL